MIEREVEVNLENKEKDKNNRPIVVTSVTLGKDLHAGHLLLLSVADLVNRSLESKEPVILVNNNTGPRPAGVVLSLANILGIDIEQAVKALDEEFIDPRKIVSLYRARDENGQELERAIHFLDEGNFDIFSAMAKSTQEKLENAGFDVRVVPESGNLKEAADLIGEVNPLWKGTGFMFDAKNGVRILQKGGRLTATGKCFVSLVSLGRNTICDGGEPFVVFVDSSPDSIDAIHALKTVFNKEQVALVHGSGITFEEKMASGTNGEALTLSEIAREFSTRCPGRLITKAFRHMILTMPAVRTRGLSYIPYDFKDNESFISAVVVANQMLEEFEAEIHRLVDSLVTKIGDKTYTIDGKLEKWFSFLPFKAKAILDVAYVQTSAEASNMNAVRDPIRIANSVALQGYVGKEADQRVREYSKGDNKELVIRANRYMMALMGIVNVVNKVVSISPNDFELLTKMIQVCMRRLGYGEN